MKIINEIIEYAKENKKTIILPESMDVRVLTSASICEKENIANIILIGEEKSILDLAKENNIDLTNILIVNPKTSNLTSDFINKFYEMRKEKGMTIETATDLITNDYMYFACMYLSENLADGIVSGACHSTSNTLRPALQIIKTKKEAKLVSSFFLMEVPDCNYGENGVFIFSDAGLEPNPTSEKLASIAYEASKSFELLTKKQSITAMLSFSTMGSANHDDVKKVVEATKIVKENHPNMLVDGELQLDAAIVPEVAKSKAPNSLVAGRANVLIFPDLDAGNIGYKLVQRLAKADAYGPITQGMNKPVNDLSRGCSASDIVGAIAITAVQANNN